MARIKAKKLKTSKYHDAPRLKAIYGYEDEFKKQFGLALGLGIKKVITKIKTHR